MRSLSINKKKSPENLFQKKRNPRLKSKPNQLLRLSPMKMNQLMRKNLSKIALTKMLKTRLRQRQMNPRVPRRKKYKRQILDYLLRDYDITNKIIGTNSASKIGILHKYIPPQ